MTRSLAHNSELNSVYWFLEPIGYETWGDLYGGSTK